MLYVFYQFFHPWVSEGISVGFEPGRERRNDMMEDVYDLGDNGSDRRGASSDVEKHPFHSTDPYGIIIFYSLII